MCWFLILCLLAGLCWRSTIGFSNAMATNISTKAGNTEVDIWLADQIEATRQRFISQPEEYNLAIAQLYADHLTAGRHREYRYCDMATTERYSLPLIARRAI